MSKRMEIEADTELGRKLMDIKLGYFSYITSVAMRNLSDKEREKLNITARAYSMELVNALNEIEGTRERLAIASMVAVNFAVSLYLTIDEAATALDIEETFGGGSRD